MTFDKVKEIIIDSLSVDEDKVVLEASLSDDLEADSLDAVELIMAIEDEFGIEIPDERIESLRNCSWYRCRHHHHCDMCHPTKKKVNKIGIPKTIFRIKIVHTYIFFVYLKFKLSTLLNLAALSRNQKELDIDKYH